MRQKDKDPYANAIPILGGFHQLRVIQEILYKQHQCIRYKNWFVDSEVTAPESVDKLLKDGITFCLYIFLRKYLQQLFK